MAKHRREKNILHGIAISFTKRKIQKYQRQLGNGHDAELHLAVAELYQHLEDKSLALESYHAAAASLLKEGEPLSAGKSNQLIKIYKHILILTPLNEEISNKLGQEYLRRGFHYRAVELHTSLAERYTRYGKYRKAIAHYQQLFDIEPKSISARIICTHLYCQLGEYEKAAQEYIRIGDIYFEHQKFDGALEYYRQASELDPSDETITHKVALTQQILEGALIPQAQASLQKLSNMSQDTSYLQRSLAEKGRVEQELRHNIQLLKQRYQQSVTSKNEQLRITQKRLEELSTYVAVFKDHLETIAFEKQKLQEQLDRELTHKHDLEKKLTQLSTLHVCDCQIPEQQSSPYVASQTERLESALSRLNQEKARLEKQLQRRLEKSTERESELRDHLEQENSRGIQLENQLTQITQERQNIERKLRYQLRESLDRENMLQEQMKQLLEEHECALQQIEQQKQLLEEKYHSTQARMNISEKHNITTLEQLHGELSRQYKMECSFSERLHESLQEITMLLHNQEEEIQQLKQL
jgi:tetratricopeptide (TPR) repeat protein